MKARMGVLGALMAFLCQQKNWWLAPAVVALILVALLAALGAASPLAPFIYPLF
jgi:membrane glycosyltransferase